jgi:hypothetical protein
MRLSKREQTKEAWGYGETEYGPEEEDDEVEKDAVEEARGGDAQLEVGDDAAEDRDDRRRQYGRC